MHIPYPELPHNPPEGFRIRDAVLNDVEGITDIWFASFNPSHKFFEYATPNTPTTRQWLNELWRMGIKAGPGVIRTFVVEDLSHGNKLAAFSRWHVPQEDGNQDIPMPAFPADWDPEITDALWGGMARTRLRVMGQRPHWSKSKTPRSRSTWLLLIPLLTPVAIVGEFIAIDPAYQNRRLAFPLMDWVRRQSDATGLESYGDSSMKGLPIWKHYGYEERGMLKIPGRPGCYGTYEIVAISRPPKAKVIGNLEKL